jgi:RimJ/RimL family protein N-acetyltransferase
MTGPKSSDQGAVARSDRLVFRRLSPAGAEAFYALNSDPEVVRYTGDVPFRSVAEARAYLRFCGLKYAEALPSRPSAGCRPARTRLSCPDHEIPDH